MFTKEKDQYGRDLDQVGHYVRDAARYISITKDIPYEEAFDKIKQAIGPGGRFEFKDPRILFLAKETEGNRLPYQSTVSGYLRKIAERRCILAPTMTSYLHPEEKRSVLAEYILGNLAKRKEVKGKMFECDMAGDKEGESFYNILQTTYKVKNNSLSGAHASASTPLFNKSSHSTLTSLCRAASGTANASNERFNTGNRHYYNQEITINNIVSIVNNSNYEAIQVCIDLYGLACPTATQTIAVIRRSTDLYWRSEEKFKPIENLVRKLKPIERAAFCYTGDLWHLKEFNDSFVHRFITDLIAKDTTPVDDPAAAIKRLDADQYAMVGLFCGDILHGSTLRDVMKEGGDRLAAVGSIAEHTLEAIKRYQPLYAAFFITDNVPSSMADFPSSIRRTAVVSDTDSTIFTVQDWIMWYCGKLEFTEQANDVATAMVYLTSQLVKHYLAVVSGNLGIVSDKIHNISMKNEYMFPVFVLTPRAKHYFAYMSAREGNVYLEPKLEVKGVTLKNSKVPDAIMSGATQLIRDIMDTVLRGEYIDINAILKMVADREREIEQSIKSGEIRYLTTGQVKSPDSYSNPESSPYAYYILWQSVFADKYGQSDPPPFFAIKTSVTTTNKTTFQAWIDSIEDRALADRLSTWATANGRDKMTTIMLPANIASSGGVPPEITRVIDTRKIIYNTMEAYYLILESLGYYINVGDSIQNLISDRH